MLRLLAVILLLHPIAAHAQTVPQSGMAHHMSMGDMPMSRAVGATQPGQGAFAAIQEIVELLGADPSTDWSKVNIDTLRQHLIDMDNVTLHAIASSEPIDGGMRFTVVGQGAVQGSIRRMVLAHAAVMNSIGDWHFTAKETEGGAELTVVVRASDVAKLKALGFMGLMSRGMHHQAHHLMLARGMAPHQ